MNKKFNIIVILALYLTAASSFSMKNPTETQRSIQLSVERGQTTTCPNCQCSFTSREFKDNKGKVWLVAEKCDNDKCNKLGKLALWELNLQTDTLISVKNAAELYLRVSFNHTEYRNPLIIANNILVSSSRARPDEKPLASTIHYTYTSKYLQTTPNPGNIHCIPQSTSSIFNHDNMTPQQNIPEEDNGQEDQANKIENKSTTRELNAYLAAAELTLGGMYGLEKLVSSLKNTKVQVNQRTQFSDKDTSIKARLRRNGKKIAVGATIIGVVVALIFTKTNLFSSLRKANKSAL